MLKRRIQDLTVCFTYNFSCLQPQNRSQKDFRSQYQLREEIQRGGFGIVYKAYRIKDGLSVAVKYIEHKHVREWTMYENQLIPTEVCHLELCSNIPGVVNLIDWFASSRGFMIVMERPEKCMDLFDVITVYGKLDEDVARWIFVQIVDAVLEMKVMHSLVHRDIKDENIIVNMETGEVKLVDFGAADFVDSAQKKHFQGTRSYCPPEWFKQRHYLPLEATTWSLGILLYTMLVGKVPFRNEIQTCMGCLHFPSEMSPDCQQLIRKCLCVTPKRRLNLAEIRAHPWTCNNPSLKYAGAFSTLLRKRSLKYNNGRRRRRRQNSVAWSLSSECESEDEPALRRSFLLAAPAVNTHSESSSLTPQQASGQLTPKDLNVSVYDFLPSSLNTPVSERSDNPPTTSTVQQQFKENGVIQRASTKRNPLLRQLAEEKKEPSVNLADLTKQDESFDMFQSVTSQFSRYDSAREKAFDRYDTARDKIFDRYDTAREKTFDTYDSASLGRTASSVMYYSACESLPDSENPDVEGDSSDPTTNSRIPVIPFYYEDSLRSLVLFGDDPDVDQAVNDRSRTPTVEETSAPTPQPSPKLSTKLRVHAIEEQQPTTSSTRKSVADSLNKLAANGVRRAKSLKINFRDKSTPSAKKLSTANDESISTAAPSINRQSLPLKVVQHLAANSYDTLVTLSAKMADKSSKEEKQTEVPKESDWKDSRMQKISKNLGDIVAERRKLLLENAKVDEREQKTKSKRSKSRDSAASKSLQYETVRFPLAVFDVCQQQLPLLEQCSK